MAKKLKVALLRGDDYHNEYLERLLNKHFDLVATVIEPGDAQRRKIIRQRRYLDYCAALYHHYRRQILGLNKFRKRFFAGPITSLGSTAHSNSTMWAEDINNVEVQTFIKRHHPDVCIISCVTILSNQFIDNLDAAIINIHGGHLPDFRGCHCFFFAVINKEFDKIGSTIHYVDYGIDTGPIIEVARPEIREDDTPESLYCKAEKLAAELLCKHLETLALGGYVESMEHDFKGRLILRRHRNIFHDLRYHAYRKLGLLQLPNVAEMEVWRKDH